MAAEGRLRPKVQMMAPVFVVHLAGELRGNMGVSE
jgi:hypothetical protein